MTSPTERQRILSDLAKLGIRDLVGVWRRAALADTDFAALILAAFPEIATAYAQMAADLAADWYSESAPNLPYVPVTAPLLDRSVLEKSVEWALGGNGDVALNRMSGTLQRTVFGGARDTIAYNVDSEAGSKWVRHASANACAFCALLASRSTDAPYRSKHSATRVVGRGKAVSTNFNADGTRKAGGQAQGVKLRGSRKLGEKFHDNCHCIAVEIRPGASYDPPSYVEDWQRAYKDAFDAVPNGMAYDSNNSVLKAVLANMRTDLGSH